MLKMLDVRATATPRAYLFGGFRLDAAHRLLLRDSHVLPLPERIFQILLMLIEANGDIVHREAIAARIWPETAVTDGNIAQHIYLLRKILGEHARDRGLVMAVNRQGYRLTVPVTGPPPDLHDSDARPDVLPEGVDADEFGDYCEGSYLLERRTARALKRATEVFEATLARNPKQVHALVGLARAYALLAQQWHVPASSAFSKAKDAVGRALALAPSFSAAHSVLAAIVLYADWDWERAHEELGVALRLNPNSSIVSCNAVDYHICTGDYDRSVAEAKRALLMEPSSLSRQLALGVALIHAGKYRQGIACMSKLLDSDETYYIARRYRAQAFLFDGQPEEALTDLILSPQERSEDYCFRLPLLARAYADCGEAGRADEIYTNLMVSAGTEYVLSWNLAIVAVALGRFDEGLAHLERALEQREPALLFLKSLPWFTPIGDRARFQEIARAVGPSPAEGPTR
jgi:DNA-binding winged helix-turn-helix (wHTH) protein